MGGARKSPERVREGGVVGALEEFEIGGGACRSPGRVLRLGGGACRSPGIMLRWGEGLVAALEEC